MGAGDRIRFVLFVRNRQTVVAAMDGKSRMDNVQSYGGGGGSMEALAQWKKYSLLQQQQHPQQRKGASGDDIVDKYQSHLSSLNDETKAMGLRARRQLLPKHEQHARGWNLVRHVVEANTMRQSKYETVQHLVSHLQDVDVLDGRRRISTLREDIQASQGNEEGGSMMKSPTKLQQILQRLIVAVKDARDLVTYMEDVGLEPHTSEIQRRLEDHDTMPPPACLARLDKIKHVRGYTKLVDLLDRQHSLNQLFQDSWYAFSSRKTIMGAEGRKVVTSTRNYVLESMQLLSLVWRQLRTAATSSVTKTGSMRNLHIMKRTEQFHGLLMAYDINIRNMSVVLEGYDDDAATFGPLKIHHGNDMERYTTPHSLHGPSLHGDSNSIHHVELKKNLSVIEKAVNANQKEKLARVFRTTTAVRRGLSAAELKRAIAEVLAEDNESRSLLIKYVSLVKPDESDDVDMNAGETDPVVNDVEKDDHLDRSDLIEVEIYLSLLVISKLFKAQLGRESQALTDAVRVRSAQFNRRSLDIFASRALTYYAYAHERFGNNYAGIRPVLLAAHRTACLRSDEIGQSTLLNLLLRNYLHENLYDQAFKLVSKTTFPEAVSNNQFVRYLYYVGKIHAVQLDYTDSYTKLMQSIRKAPQNTAVGFRRTVHKLAIIVQLLMGEVPERSIFNQDEFQVALEPYLKLTNAVRLGNLEDFTTVLTHHAETFKTDKTYTLILRLRHNVIKTGLRKINTSYSKIRFTAIKDGVIDAVIDHKNGWMQSKETVDVYVTNEPQQAFHKRITFCLDVHNEAVKAMRYPPGAYKKDLESAEERLEREKQEEELAKEIEDELDDGI
ncbi:hypothetical protein DYB36_011961 [Aphanomyces astaci]|uniref:PCI domain-containing protein n=1 Tax=Aphanomyces astaci TaxID=112090 RepID=A0A397ADN8_APHAT|nr:hypothetical protein DYB36_011961 [Aphanomyces astaci]